ncbi:MAG TPA: glycoside hydrolase [Bacteroidetes bacterium]|nr:glycoside hydrolase [Bacteroidota bacterium]
MKIHEKGFRSSVKLITYNKYKKNRKIKYLICLILSIALAPNIIAEKVYDIRKFGATTNANKINTIAINSAIEACTAGGGGKVLIPKGSYITGTIILKDNVQLYLEEGAVLNATTNLNEYQSYIPTKDLSKFTTNVADNVNSSLDPHWTRALILAVGTNNVSISGEGIINGNHVFDAQGEEKMRGPHTVIIAESRNFSMSGITINCAANYAFLGYLLENVVFHNLEINEGWDGIHIRGGKNITIRNCRFQTGDDAIAGGYWENMVITDCYINSSCNGIRMIMPAENLTISNCDFIGPGKYSHRTSKEKMRTNTLSAILLQPGAWGIAPGEVKDVHIQNINIDNVNNPFMIVLNEGNEGKNIFIENMQATNINLAALSIESWKGGMFENVDLRDISIESIGDNKTGLSNSQIEHPQFDSRPLPCWGGLIRNVHNISFKDVKLTYRGVESRPALWFDNVTGVTFNNFKYQENKNDNPIVKINVGTFTTK